MRNGINFKGLPAVTFLLILEACIVPDSSAQLQPSQNSIINFYNESSVEHGTSAYVPKGVSENERPEGQLNSKSSLKPELPTWSLEKCYEIALEKSNSIKQQQNNISTAIIDRKIVRNSLLPSVSYNMGHYFSFGKNIDPVTNAFSFESFSGGYTSLGIELDIFSGFKKINSIKENTFRIKAFQYSEKKTGLELLTNITITYARLLLDREELNTMRNVIDNTLKELDIINEKIKVGRLTKYDFYAFNARLNTEQADLISYQNDSLNTSQDLKQLLNISYKEKFNIALLEESILHDICSADFSEGYGENILLAHPAIRQAEAMEAAARLQLKIVRSNSLPSLFIGGNIVSNYSTDQKNINGSKIPLSVQLDNNLGKNINIGVSIPIFSQLENVNLVKKEKINISNAQLEVETAKNSVATDVLHLINDFTSAKEKYNATLSAFEQNNLSYNLYLEKYRQGQISSVELITAQDILNTATSKYLEAKLQLYFRFQLLELLKKYSAE